MRVSYVSHVLMLASLAACVGAEPTLVDSISSKEQGASPTPDIESSDNTTPSNQTPVSRVNNNDAGVDTCVPSTCESHGYTCGSFTDCDGKQRTCGDCNKGSVCSGKAGVCTSVAAVCNAQKLTLLGACVNWHAPSESSFPGCSVAYSENEGIEYRDNTTAIPALTLRDQCEQQDTPETITCSNGDTAIAHTHIWLDEKSEPHTRVYACRIQSVTEGNCSERTEWYAWTVTEARAIQRCSESKGTLITP